MAHEHEHDHDHVIMLKNEDGEERAFELVCTFDVDDKTYAILADTDSDDAVAMRVEGETEEDTMLVPVTDDAEFEAVAKAYDDIDPEDLWGDEE